VGRPEGYIAARGHRAPADPARELADVLCRVAAPAWRCQRAS
jgi:hypothetical protein